MSNFPADVEFSQLHSPSLSSTLQKKRNTTQPQNCLDDNIAQNDTQLSRIKRCRLSEMLTYRTATETAMSNF